MEFTLDDNRAGAGSSTLLSPEVVAIRTKLIDICDGKTFLETIDFLKQLIEKEQDEQKRLGILAARVYVLRQRILYIQEQEDASLLTRVKASNSGNLNDADQKTYDDEPDDSAFGWVRLRIINNSIVNGVRFPKGVIVDVSSEEADALVSAGKAEIVDVSSDDLEEIERDELEVTEDKAIQPDSELEQNIEISDELEEQPEKE